MNVVISGSATSGHDNTDSWVLTGGNDYAQLQIEATPSGSPTQPTLVSWSVTTTVYKVPLVTTLAATTVKDTYATLNGDITLLVNGSATTEGFAYDTVSHAGSPPSSYAHEIYSTGSFGLGDFSLTPATLIKNTTYYFIAYATDSVGTGYGTELTFTTLNPQGSSTGVGFALVGGITPNQTYASGLTAFSVTNIGTCAINVELEGANATGGDTWTLSNTATPGADTFGLEAGTSSYNVVVTSSGPYNVVVTDIAPGTSATFGIELLSPTSISDSVTKNFSVTVLYVAY
jgi:hypothetical protein